jgi:hypothetical protein
MVTLSQHWWTQHKKTTSQEVHKKKMKGYLHQGREIIAIIPLENGAFCTIFSEDFHKF